MTSIMLTLRTTDGDTQHWVYRIIPNAARTGYAFAYVEGGGVLSFAWCDVRTIGLSE